MPLNSLQDLYLEQLQDLYSAEEQIVGALPKLIGKASHSRLRDGFTQHLEQTREHLRRLDEIGQRFGKSLSGKKCKGMEGLLREGEEILNENADTDVIDAALIAAAQRVEHYEIAAYGCTRTYADALGRREDVTALQRTLDEESETDRKLTQIAENIVNPDAQKATTASRDTSRAESERARNEIRP